MLELEPRQATLDFRILGTLSVESQGRPLELGGPKQRGLLGLLLLHPNETLSRDLLIDALWADNPPQKAINAIQVYVWRLRQVLGQGRIRTEHGGYSLQVHEDELDLEIFRRLVAEARTAREAGDASSAAEVLREALNLWRDVPFADLRYDRGFQGEIVRLEEERLSALEERVELDLELGRHAEVVGELEEAVAAYPFRERFAELMMIALYRSGRQGDALLGYVETRRRLVEELGIEPTPSLTDLHHRILRHDEALQPPPPVMFRALKARRRHVSILFIELSLTAAIDPEIAARRLSRARAAVRSALEAHGALVTEPLGDTVIGVFGLPAAREDDALRALIAASELPAVFEPLDLIFRAAIDTAEVLADDEGVSDDHVPGRMMRLTSRVAADETVISDATYRLVSDHVKARRIRNSRAWRVVGLHEPAPFLRHPREAPLVGREVELRRLCDAFEWVRSTSRPHLLTLIGVAGIGKSRVADELAREVRRKALILRGRCISYRTGTFLPLTEMVIQAAGGTDRSSLERLLSGSEDAPVVIDQLAAALAPTAHAMAEDAFWAFRRMFGALARDRPLLLIFDDLHWGEERLLTFINDLALSSRTSPILIVCLARPELLERHPAWGSGRADSQVVRLEPLSTDASEALLTVVADDLPRNLRGRIIERAEGNALFIEQMAALLAEDPSTPPETIPPSIHAILSARLDRLGSIERAILDAAAVIGTHFTLGEVRALAQEPLPETLAAPLEQLHAREFIRPALPDRPDGKRWRFRHGLVHEAVYGALLKADRAHLHERLASWLDRSDDKTAETDHLVGQHLEKAYLLRSELDPADPSLSSLAADAGQKLASAGQREAQRSDTGAAIDLLARGLWLLPQDAPPRGAALADLAYTARLAGKWDIVRESLDQGFAFADRAGDVALREYLTASQLQLRLHTDPNFDVEEILTTASHSLKVLETLDADAYTARVRVVIAWAYALRGQCGAAERMISVVTRDLPETRRLLPTLWLGGRMRVEEVRHRCSLLLEEQPDRRTAASCYRTFAVTEAMLAKFDDAREYARLARTTVEELGLPIMAAATSAVGASIELMAGDPDQAEREGRAALEHLRRLNATMHTGGVTVVLADSLYEQGRDREAWAALESAVGTVTQDVVDRVRLHTVRAKLLNRFDRAPEGLLAATEAVAVADTTDSPSLRGDARYHRGLALRQCGMPREAARELDAALALYERKGNVVSASLVKSSISRP